MDRTVARIVKAAERGIQLEDLLRRLKLKTYQFDAALKEAEKTGVEIWMKHGLVCTGEGAIRESKRRELNQWVRRIIELKEQSAERLWTLGGVIDQLYKSKLWQLREDRWEDFCKNELHMSPVHAMRLADCHANFAPKQVLAHGVTKLSLLLSAPEDARPALMAKVESGASSREIELEVRAAKKKTGFVRAARDGSKRHAPTRQSTSMIECPHCGATWTPRGKAGGVWRAAQKKIVGW